MSSLGQVSSGNIVIIVFALAVFALVWYLDRPITKGKIIRKFTLHSREGVQYVIGISPHPHSSPQAITYYEVTELEYRELKRYAVWEACEAVPFTDLELRPRLVGPG